VDTARDLVFLLWFHHRLYRDEPGREGSTSRPSGRNHLRPDSHRNGCRPLAAAEDREKILKEFVRPLLLRKKLIGVPLVEFLSRLYYAHVREADTYVEKFFDILANLGVLYEQGYRSLGAASSSQISQKGVPAWEQDLEHSRERAGRRQDKEKMMAGLRKLGYM